MPDQTLSRRHFLKLGAASIAALGLAGGCRRRVRAERIGLALGGGGARGLAHVLVFEALEELGLCGCTTRLPLVPASPATRDALRQALTP